MGIAREVMKGKEGWAAGLTRCVATGLLIYLMPTTVITMTARLLTDVEEEREKEGKDFFQAQAISELIRQQVVPGAWAPGAPTMQDGGWGNSSSAVRWPYRHEGVSGRPQAR